MTSFLPLKRQKRATFFRRFGGKKMSRSAKNGRLAREEKVAPRQEAGRLAADQIRPGGANLIPRGDSGGLVRPIFKGGLARSGAWPGLDRWYLEQMVVKIDGINLK